MKTQPKARYFCEACGAEVRAGASVCPSCGSLFTAVRCPECSYEGRAPEFRNGCPVCGYRTRSRENSAPSIPKQVEKRMLPVGFYRAAIIILGALILGLVLILVLGNGT